MAESKKILKIDKKLWYSSSWFLIGCLGLLTFIVFWQFIFSDKMLFSSDQVSGFDGRVFLANAFKKYLQFPLWFSSRLSGMPTIDAMFGDIFYLPSNLISLFASVPRTISYKMVFHVFLAGAFFFLLLRKGFRLSPLISFIGASFYMFNPQFFSLIYPGHDGKMFVIAWLPFLIWRIKCLTDGPSFLNASLLSLGMAMMFSTSHVQMSYFVLWGLGFYWVFSTALMFFKENQRKKGVFFSLYFWLSVGLALGIGLVQLYPTYMYVREAFSVRGVERGFDYAASWSLHWPEVFSLWIPEFVNTLQYYWGQNPFKLNSEYAGVFTLMLAILAIISKPRSWRIFWGGIALFSVLYGLGAHSPVYHFAYYLVPGVKKFRAASMIMFWFSFSTVLLASLFLKDLLSGKFNQLSEVVRKRWLKGIMITCGVVFVVGLLFSSKGFVLGLFETAIQQNSKTDVFEANFSKQFLPSLWFWIISTIGLAGMFYGVVVKKINPRILVLAFFVLGMIDILRVDSRFIKLIDPKPYFYNEPVLEQLSEKMQNEPFRCFSFPGALPQNGEGIHGLEGVSGFHDNELRWYREFRGDQQDRNYLKGLIGFDQQNQPYLKAEQLEQGNAFLNLANVKYLLVRSQNQLLAIENRNALGRVSFASDYVVMDSSKITSALKSETYDYHTTVALQKEPSVKPRKINSEVNGFSAIWEKYSPNYRKVKVNSPSDGFLRISETWYPGWEVRIDGKKVDVYKADLAWMAVPISQGASVVEISAHSIYLGRVLPVSVVIALFLLTYWSVVSVRYFRKKHGNS